MYHLLWSAALSSVFLFVPFKSERKNTTKQSSCAQRAHCAVVTHKSNLVANIFVSFINTHTHNGMVAQPSNCFYFYKIFIIILFIVAVGAVSFANGKYIGFHSLF